MNGIKKFKLVALDSNIFIYNLEQNTQFTPFTDVIFTQLISNKLKAVTSIISLTEILSYPNTSKLEKQIIEDFLSTPNLEVSDINQEIAVEAARIRREYGYRLPDSIQLATAKLSKAKVFVSNDVRLKSIKGLKIMLLEKMIS